MFRALKMGVKGPLSRRLAGVHLKNSNTKIWLVRRLVSQGARQIFTLNIHQSICTFPHWNGFINSLLNVKSVKPPWTLESHFSKQFWRFFFTLNSRVINTPGTITLTIPERPTPFPKPIRRQSAVAGPLSWIQRQIPEAPRLRSRPPSKWAICGNSRPQRSGTWWRERDINDSSRVCERLLPLLSTLARFRTWPFRSR